MPHYHYIIVGAGASGLSLLVRMIKSKKFQGKKILLIDRQQKNANDRTWCFWEKKDGFFEEVVYKKWPVLWYHAPGYSARNDIHPYQYKLIRGIDFYNYCFDIIRGAPEVQHRIGEVQRVISTDAGTWIEIEGEKITADFIFNSIIPPAQKEEGLFELLQHFKGWVINTTDNAFNPEEATLMDFRGSQASGTAFYYVMPFSANRALVEYTLFSEAIEPQENYVIALKEYIDKTLRIKQYNIESEEFGVIPMTNRKFPERINNIVYIGTAGGNTKPSSGYTFQFIQKHSSRIIESLLTKNNPFGARNFFDKRFDFYDSTLLNILVHKKMQGMDIFTQLFRENNITDVLQFLDNETTLAQEWRLVSVLPTKLFMRAAFQQLR